jgi:hypothetical protein
LQIVPQRVSQAAAPGQEGGVVKGTWQTTSGGDNGLLVAVLGAAVGCAVVCAAVDTVARAVGAIPVWVIIAIPVVIVTVTVAGLRALLRSNRRQGEAFAARCEERRALEAAEKEDRRQHRLEVAAAQAPVIHNWIVTPAAAIAARERGFTPATIFTGQKEIPQR